MRFAQLTMLLASGVLCATLLGGSYPTNNVTQGFDRPDGTLDLADGSTIGADGKLADGSPVAAIYGSALRLTDKGTTNAIGSFKLPDLDPGNVIKSFDLRFTVIMAAPTGTIDNPAGNSAGEGWSVNFGNIPPDNGTGEGGFAPLPRGLTVAFDTGNDLTSPTSIRVFSRRRECREFPLHIFARRKLPKHRPSLGRSRTGSFLRRESSVFRLAHARLLSGGW